MLEQRRLRERDLLADGTRTAAVLAPAGRHLSYFPIDPAWRVGVHLELARSGARATRDRVNGETDELILVGTARGTLQGQPFELEVAQLRDGRRRIDFRDATSGSESFAFRYVYLEGDADAWWVDFNLAQNPLCAYGDGFRCLVAPPQNTLPIAVRAGERRPE